MEINPLDKSVMEKFILEVLKEQRCARRWKIFFRLIWLAIVIIISISAIFTNKHGESLIKSGKEVAVINLNGIISNENNTYKNLADSLTTALKNKNTVAVIIRANSPGGSPVYSNMGYSEILRQRKLYPKKPIDVVVEEVCASGCYYIAAAADKIYANPSSIVGSIGVIYTGFGLTGLMAKIGVDSRLLISGKNKAMGYPFVPINKEQEFMQQKMLDQVHRQFILAVKNGRGNRLQLVPDLFSGRYWLGEDGLKLGLIDGYASVNSLARDQFKTENVVDFTVNEDSWDKLVKKFGTDVMDSARQAVLNAEFGSFH